MGDKTQRTLQWISKLLRIISTARDTSDALERHAGHVQQLRQRLEAMCKISGAEAALRGEPLLVEQLGRATKLAMEQVAVHCRGAESKPVLLHAMSMLFDAQMHLIHHLAGLEGWNQPCRQHIVNQLDKLGFMPAFAAAASAMHEAIECGSPVTAYNTANTAAHFFFTCRMVFGAWPHDGTVLAGSSISQTIVPISKLVLSFMRVCGSSLRSDHHSPVSAGEVGPACHLIEMFQMVLVDELLKTPVTSERVEALSSSLASGDLLLLLLAHLACIAQVLHEKQQGRSAASVAGALRSRGFGAQLREGIIVPAYHQQLLETLGIGTRVKASPEAFCVKNTMTECLADKGVDPSQALRCHVMTTYMVARIMHLAASRAAAAATSEATETAGVSVHL